MKIYDCFTYFDEDLILDTRLNILNDYVDYFVIVESTFNHNGESRQLKFDINKFEKFKHKIIYIIVKDLPDGQDPYSRENYQRNSILKGLKNSEDDDLITFGFYDENLGQIYIAETRNDHQEFTGNGELVKIYVTAKANSSNTGAILTTEGGVTAQGDTVEFNGGEDGTNVNSIDDRDNYMVKDLIVFPNPTSDNVTYSLPTGSVSNDYRIEVFDNVGALLYSIKRSGGGTIIQSFKEYDSGIYIDMGSKFRLSRNPILFFFISELLISDSLFDDIFESSIFKELSNLNRLDNDRWLPIYFIILERTILRSSLCILANIIMSSLSCIGFFLSLFSLLEASITWSNRGLPNVNILLILFFPRNFSISRLSLSFIVIIFVIDL